jgi:hypothetical protein
MHVQPLYRLIFVGFQIPKLALIFFFRAMLPQMTTPTKAAGPGPGPGPGPAASVGTPVKTTPSKSLPNGLRVMNPVPSPVGPGNAQKVPLTRPAASFNAGASANVLKVMWKFID